MRGRLLAAIMVGLLIGAGEPRQGNLGKMEYQFTVPSKWVLVRGYFGQDDIDLTKGSLHFTKAGKGEIDIYGESGSSYRKLFTFQVHPLSKLPIISDMEIELVKTKLVLRGSTRALGDFYLIFKAARE